MECTHTRTIASILSLFGQVLDASNHINQRFGSEAIKSDNRRTNSHFRGIAGLFIIFSKYAYFRGGKGWDGGAALAFRKQWKSPPRSFGTLSFSAKIIQLTIQMIW